MLGLVAPGVARVTKWLADAFIQLIKTVTSPVIFVTVVVGIASLGNLARASRLAPRALGYFLAATMVALVLGLLAGNLVKPGAGFEGGPSAVLAILTGCAVSTLGPQLREYIVRGVERAAR